MKEIKKYMDIIARHPDKEEKAKKLVCEMAEKMKEHCPDTFWHYITKLHVLACGPHFDEATAKMAVANMHNVDGTHGEHWSMEDTDKLAIAHGIAHKCDFYYAMNMLHSDLSEVVGKDPTMYAKMVKAMFFTDIDMTEGKLFYQWIATFEK